MSKFKIQSLRTRGTVVQILHKGRVVHKQIKGRGVIFSDGRTGDMVEQQTAGFIKIEQLGAPAPEPTPAPEPPVTPPEPTPPVTPPPSINEEPTNPGVEMMSKADFKRLTKDELRELAEDNGIELSGSTKAEYVETLVEYDIPKE